MAAQEGLIDDVEKWFEFLKARNQASHIYDEATADSVYSQARDFLKAVRDVGEKVS